MDYVVATQAKPEYRKLNKIPDIYNFRALKLHRRHQLGKKQ